MGFPALDALREGDDVYPVVDAIEEPPRKPTAPASSWSSKQEAVRSAGSRSPASSYAHLRVRGQTTAIPIGFATLVDEIPVGGGREIRANVVGLLRHSSDGARDLGKRFRV